MSLVICCFLFFSSIYYVPVKNNLTMERGEWGGDSEERGLQELLLGRMDKIKGEGGGGGGKWVQLGWGGGMGRKGTQL